MPRKRSPAEEQQETVTIREPGDETDREPQPPQRGWKHDNAAGVERLLYNDGEQKVYEFWLKFRDGKPSDAVRAYMKDNGFRWAPDAPTGGRWPEVKGAWVRPVGYETRSQDRLQPGVKGSGVFVDMLVGPSVSVGCGPCHGIHESRNPASRITS